MLNKIQKIKKSKISNQMTKEKKFNENSSTKNDVIKVKTKVEITMNGIEEHVYWIKIPKSSNTVTLNDIKKHLWKQPRQYGMSKNMVYNYSVKTIEDAKVGFEDVDEDDSILPLYGDKIVLQCWLAL